MTPASYAHLKRLFVELCELPPVERAERLDRARVAGELRAELQGLLEAHDRGGSNPSLRDEQVTPTLAGGLGTRMAAIPERLGPIRLVREIGRGGMGVVWLGYHDMLGREVAIKFLINAARTTHDPGYGVLLDGARVAAGVRHPNLTHIQTADLFEGVPYLVMEFVNGPDLEEVCRQRGRLDVRICLALMESVLSAVAELHARDIVHRDIKPSNVLLGGDGHVFVTDFGLACPRPFGTAGAPSGAAAGTPSFMAPEMFDGAVSTRSDVYALGLMLFKFITGKLPYRGELDALRNAHLIEPLPVHWLEEHAVHAAVIEVIRRCTNKQPLYRYKAADHLLRSLRDAAREAGIVAASPAELRSLGQPWSVPPGPPGPLPKPSATPSSFYQTLGNAAARRRSVRPSGEACRATPAAASHGQPVLNADVPCISCGYNLRGLPSDREACPSCGAAIRDSLMPDRLMFADRRWINRIRRGMIVTEVGILLLPVWLITLAVVGAGFPVLIAGGSLVGVLVATGIVLARPASRAYSAMAAAVWTLALVDLGVTGYYVSDIWTGAAPRAWQWVSTAAQAALVLAVVVYLCWLRLLLLRTPSARLAKSAGQFAWALPVAGLLFLAAAKALASASDGVGAGTSEIVRRIGSLAPGLLLIAVIVGVVGVLRKARRTISAELSRLADCETLYGAARCKSSTDGAPL